MSKPEDIEGILARLMPTALSQRAETEIGETINRLASEADLEIPAIRPAAVARWPWVAGAAAAAVIAVFVFWDPSDLQHSVHRADSPALIDVPELVRISHSDTLQSVVQEGWSDDVGGKPHQALRLHMVAQQQILDEETGIVMTVSEPREEVLLVPVHTF
jgi:hypothetical protein